MAAKFDRQLGPGFVIRDGRAHVPMPGALPMAIPEKKTDDWIAEKKGVERARLGPQKAWRSCAFSGVFANSRDGRLGGGCQFRWQNAAVQSVKEPSESRTNDRIK